jgi:hypothetical protein
VIDQAGSYNLDPFLGTRPTPHSVSFTISPAAPVTLVFLTQPSNTVAGQVISPSVQVELFDAFGNVATNSTASVTLKLASNPGGATLSGTKTVAVVNGVATFTNLSLNKAAKGYQLKATEGTLTATSTLFDVL